MASLVQVNEALGKVVAFLAPLVPLIGCHMVDFFTLRHWDTLLPPQLQEDLLNLPSDALHLLPSAALPHTSGNTTPDSDEPWSLSSSDLSSFLLEVRRHCPMALGMTTPIEQILGEYGSAEIDILAMKGIMSNKKTHEVDTMAQVIARLAKGLDVRWLVDLGSGRGYLSTSLVLQYSLSVVAIDSSTANTNSALVRNTKLKRWWDNLRQTWLDKAEGRPVKKGKKTRRKKPLTSPEQQQQKEQKEQLWRQEGKEENMKQEDRKQGSMSWKHREEEDAGHKNSEAGSIDKEDRIQKGRINQEERKQGNTTSQNYRTGENTNLRDGKQEKIISQERQQGKTSTQEERTNQEERRSQDNRKGEKASQEDKEQENTNQKDRKKKITSQKEIKQEMINQEGKEGENTSQGDRNEDENKEEDRNEEETMHEGKRKEDIPTQARVSKESRPSHHTGCYIGVTKFITEDTDLLEVVRSAIKAEKDAGESRNTDESGRIKNEEDKRGYCSSSHITTDKMTRKQPPQPDTHQEQNAAWMVDEASSLGLVGLHTCGNLASSSLRLFRANPKVAFLCNVGCCYHLLEEEFSRNTYNQEKMGVSEGELSRLSKEKMGVSEGELSRLSKEKMGVSEEELSISSKEKMGLSEGELSRLSKEKMGVSEGELSRLSKEKMGVNEGELSRLSKEKMGLSEEELCISSIEKMGLNEGELSRLSKEEEECVSRFEEENRIVALKEQESYAIKLSMGSSEQVGKPDRLAQSEEDVKRCEESEGEKAVYGVKEKETNLLKFPTDDVKQIGKTSRLIQQEENVQRGKEEEKVLLKGQESYDKPSTGHTEEGEPNKFIQKDGSVQRHGENELEKCIICLNKEECNPLKSSKSHREQVEQPTRLGHREDIIKRHEGENEVLAVIRQENYALQSSKIHMEQTRKQMRLNSKEESIRRCAEKRKFLIATKEGGRSSESSRSHVKAGKHATEPLSKVYKESAKECREIEQPSGPVEEDCYFFKSSTSYTEERERKHIDSHTSIIKKEENQRNYSPQPSPSSSLSQEHSSPNTTEKTHKNNPPPSSQPLRDDTAFANEKEETERTNSRSQKPSSSSTGEEKTDNDRAPSSQPLRDDTAFTNKKEEMDKTNSPLQPASSPIGKEKAGKGSSPPSSHPLCGHTAFANKKEEMDKTNSSSQPPSSPIGREKTDKGSSPPPPLPPPPLLRAQEEEGGQRDIDPLHPSSILNLGYGFPLSTFLRDRCFSLGRNSRMLSSQAADRLTQGNIGGADSLYWRALLQVVLVDRLGDVSHLSHVGRLSAKCHSFPEYAQVAFARLGVSLEITEEELQEYDRRHSSSKGRLERFFLLRASLAMVAEGCVLLDRLAYLCEQEDVSAFLVQLFDPVTSPRSHALVAVRKGERNTPSTTERDIQDLKTEHEKS